MLNLQEKQVHVAVCDQMTVEEISGTIDTIKTQYRICGQPLFYIALVPEEAPIPDQTVRTAMTVALRQIQEYCEFTAVIFTGEGLKASMKRTVFAGILMVMLKGRWHVAKSVDDLMTKAQGNARRLVLLQAVAKLVNERGFRI
jgi:hypothetical protein